MSKLVSALYKLARTANTVEAVASGNPTRIGRRLANLWIGRNIARRFYLPWRRR